MIFEKLADKLSFALRNIRGQGRLTEKNIQETLQKINIALLEADVELSVVKRFIQHIKEKTLGQEIKKSVTPGKAFIRIVYNELIHVLGGSGDNNDINLSIKIPSVILVVGPHGVGKTTTVGKIGKYLREKRKKKILVVSTDIYRPAAIQQLEMLAKKANVDFVPSFTRQNPVEIVNIALNQARIKCSDIVIVDTYGFLHTDASMMNNLINIQNMIKPVETLFIADAMTGQDVAKTVISFHKNLSLTGLILTKVDSDARSGIALSIRYLTGKPIKFLGMGETIDSLEPFVPERLAKRILGMGDYLSIIENIKITEENQLKRWENKLKRSENFNLSDFLEQLKRMRKLGNGSIVSRIKNFYEMKGISDVPNDLINDKIFVQMEAIINSMTLRERTNPSIIKGSRKRRIALGSGTDIQNVNQLIKTFSEMQKIMKNIKRMSNKRFFGIHKMLSSIFFEH